MIKALPLTRGNGSVVFCMSFGLRFLETLRVGLNRAELPGTIARFCAPGAARIGWKQLRPLNYRPIEHNRRIGHKIFDGRSGHGISLHKTTPGDVTIHLK